MNGSEVSLSQNDHLSRIMYAPVEYVIGVDEVGTGAWAGPIVIAATVMPKGWADPDVRDSKKYTNSKASTAYDKRRRASLIVQSVAKHVFIKEYTSEELDERRVEVCQREGFELALTSCWGACMGHTCVAVTDGTMHFVIPGLDVISLPKADSLVPAVSAASVIAKVRRDTMMRQYSEQYPEYNFAVNVGYGTFKHKSALRKYGVCPLHRRSYKPIKMMLPRGAQAW